MRKQGGLAARFSVSSPRTRGRKPNRETPRRPRHGSFRPDYVAGAQTAFFI
jgi:hypothetical protein